MAEADITTMAGLADNADNYGTASRGAFTTLATRVKPVMEQNVITHAAAGAVVIPWAAGIHHRITSAGFNITSMSETGAPTGNNITQGSLTVKNTGGASMTVDTTGLAHGLDAVLTIAAGDTEIIFLMSTPT